MRNIGADQRQIKAHRLAAGAKTHAVIPIAAGVIQPAGGMSGMRVDIERRAGNVGAGLCISIEIVAQPVARRGAAQGALRRRPGHASAHVYRPDLVIERGGQFDQIGMGPVCIEIAAQPHIEHPPAGAQRMVVSGVNVQFAMPQIDRRAGRFAGQRNPGIDAAGMGDRQIALHRRLPVGPRNSAKAILAERLGRARQAERRRLGDDVVRMR